MAIEITPYNQRETWISGEDICYFSLGKIFNRVPQVGDRIKITIDGVDYIMTGENNKFPNKYEWDAEDGTIYNATIESCSQFLGGMDIDDQEREEWVEDLYQNGVIFGNPFYEEKSDPT